MFCPQNWIFVSISSQIRLCRHFDSLCEIPPTGFSSASFGSDIRNFPAGVLGELGGPFSAESDSSVTELVVVVGGQKVQPIKDAQVQEDPNVCTV